MNYCLVTTVANNKSIFNRKEIDVADKALNLYILIGRPGERRFKQVVSSGYIWNYDAGLPDLKRARFIYGPQHLCLEREIHQEKNLAPTTDDDLNRKLKDVIIRLGILEYGDRAPSTSIPKGTPS